MENLGGAARSSTGVCGVYTDGNRFRASVCHHGKSIHVGYFATIEEAGATVRAKCNELFTHNDADRRAS